MPRELVGPSETRLPRTGVDRRAGEASAQARQRPDAADARKDTAITPAPRPPGSFPRQIAHDEQIEYSYNPETGDYSGRLVESSEPVVTAWDRSPPVPEERAVGAWDVVPNNDGVQVEASGRVTVPESIKAQLKAQAEQTGEPTTTTATHRVQHDLDTRETDTSAEGAEFSTENSRLGRIRSAATGAFGRIGAGASSAVQGAREIAADTTEGVAAGLERRDQLAAAQSRHQAARTVMQSEEQARVDALTPSARAAERARRTAARIRGNPEPEIERSDRFQRAQTQRDKAAQEIAQIKSESPLASAPAPVPPEHRAPPPSWTSPRE